jgi:hypothetical protein
MCANSSFSLNSVHFDNEKDADWNDNGRIDIAFDLSGGIFYVFFLKLRNVCLK